MNRELLKKHPLQVDPIALVRTGERLDMNLLDQVNAWADELGAGVPDAELVRPREGISIFRGMTVENNIRAILEFETGQTAENEGILIG